jgi:putative sterol carrier protein
MGVAKDSLVKVVEELNKNPKAQTVFVTNIAGKDVNWEMNFQFNLKGEKSFYLEIKNRKGKILDGTLSKAEVVMTGDPNAIVKVCNGKGDFTHAISREAITVEKGKVMDVIRFTRAITIILQKK